MNKILVAVSLSDFKLYSQIVALSVLPDLIIPDNTTIDLHLSIQTQDITQYVPLQRWLLDHQDIFAHVYTELWWNDTLDGGGDDSGDSKVIAATYHRNLARDMAIRGEYTHIWFIDSDVLVPKHALQRLLALDVSLASGVYYSRSEQCPGIPFVFCWQYGDAHGRPGQNQGHPAGTHFIRQLPTDGQMGVDFTGAGCMFIRRDVFSVLSFRHRSQDGDICELAEDGYYCQDYYQWTGQRIIVALDIHCGHVAPDLTVYSARHCPSYRRRN